MHDSDLSPTNACGRRSRRVNGEKGMERLKFLRLAALPLEDKIVLSITNRPEENKMALFLVGLALSTEDRTKQVKIGSSPHLPAHVRSHLLSFPSATREPS